MGTASYKCPNCGGSLAFKPEIQKSKCDYCLSEYSDDELEAINQKIAEEAKRSNKDQNNIENSNQAIQLISYVCNSCGAEVVTDEDTSASFCYYCHSPVLVTERLTGDFKPEKIIPFVIDKEKAKENFLRWAKSHMFVPADFYGNSQLEKLTGLYQPYWLADLQSEVDFVGRGVNLRRWRAGKRQYTETKVYRIEKRGTIELANVPAIAVDRIEKELLESITPYEDEKTVDFSMSYLSGFFAERYSYSSEDVKNTIETVGKRCNQQIVEEGVGHYQQFSWSEANQNIEIKDWHYALLPAWILTYKYNDKSYVYAVNGQTGKSYGELPLNKRKLFTVSAAISLIIFIGSLAGGILLW